MKYIANTMTISRMILSILLICFLNNRLVFVAMYAACGISDVFDGIIARKTNTMSAIGAKLDSIADFLMFGIVVISLIIWSWAKLKSLLPYIFIIILIRFANLLIAAYKYHSFIIIHTWGNKITGILIFIASILFIMTDNIVTLLPICIVAILSALEETIIHLISDKCDLNRRSIFLKQ